MSDYPLEKDTVHIFADGACTGNPGPAGIGVVLIFNGHTRSFGRALGHATNNIAELTALRDALRAINDVSYPLCIHLDSAYVIGLFTQKWKPKKNLALIQEIRDELARFSHVRFKKVKAHSDNIYNAQADALAVAATRSHGKNTDVSEPRED